MDEFDRAAHLREVPLFAEVLDAGQLAALAAKTRFASFPAGSLLMRSGDFGVAMYAIVDGRVVVRLGDGEEADAGDGAVVASLGHGDIVGEMSLMTGARRSANVTASSDVTAVEVTRAALEPILAGSPALVERFAEMLTARQAELDHAYGAGGLGGLLAGRDLAGMIRGFFGLRG